MGYDPDATPEGMTPLSALEDYEVADGSVDIRGFTVEDDRGALLGEVTDLLVDPLREVVRFVEVRLVASGDPGRRGPGVARIPVESITVDEAARRVRLERGVEPGAPPPTEEPGRPARPGRGLVIAPGEGGDVVGRTGPPAPPPGAEEKPPEPGRRKPRPQPIVRGPAVQGTGEASRERHESTEAGRGGARTVEGSGSQGPDRKERR
ncbi:MAG TPA: hypothetical protein VF406_08840 [Thermodesulfobacteriota bacterium]